MICPSCDRGLSRDGTCAHPGCDWRPAPADSRRVTPEEGLSWIARCRVRLRAAADREALAGGDP